METQSGPTPSHPTGGETPIVLSAGASKAPVSPSPSNAPASKVQPIFAGDLMGYMYLCCQRTKNQAETRSFGPVANAYSGLSRALDKIEESPLKSGSAIDSTLLKELLAAANISADIWNVVVQQVGAAKNGRTILDEANRKGEALALGLPEDATKQLCATEKRLRSEDFVGHEMARLAQRAYDVQQRARKSGAKEDISLYQVKKGSGYTIPPDGFEKYTAAVGWLISSTFIKLQGFVASLFKDKKLAEQDPVVQAAHNRTWLKPIGLSVKSPTIQALVKEMSTYSVQTKIEPISNNKGYTLEFSFTIKPRRLPLLVEKLSRQN